MLKALRIENKLSMAKAAALMDISTSTVAHTETGRINAPQGKRLERFLQVYGGIKSASFHERVRKLQGAPTAREELDELLNRANAEQTRTVLAIVRGLLG